MRCQYCLDEAECQVIMGNEKKNLCLTHAYDEVTMNFRYISGFLRMSPPPVGGKKGESKNIFSNLFKEG